MDDTGKPETVVQEPVSNDTSTATVPTSSSDNSSAELQKARKDAEQARMEANLFRNKLAEKEKLESETQAKKLEEEGQYKELLAKERAEKEALLSEKDAAERSAILSAGTNEVLGKYSPAVVDIAKTAGLSLVDDSDEAKVSLAEKLDSIQAKVGGQAKVQGNNPAPSVQQPQGKEELIATMQNTDLRARDRDAASLKFVSGLKSLDTMREQAGVAPKAQ